jgi:hypothetical protein
MSTTKTTRRPENTTESIDGHSCGRCERVGPTTHLHDGIPAHDCAYAGRAYEAGACSGDDLCDDCLEED